MHLEVFFVLKFPLGISWEGGWVSLGGGREAGGS